MLRDQARQYLFETYIFPFNFKIIAEGFTAEVYQRLINDYTIKQMMIDANNNYIPHNQPHDELVQSKVFSKN